jgi:hypothetical protein
LPGGDPLQGQAEAGKQGSRGGEADVMQPHDAVGGIVAGRRGV